ncbi:MAG TPA: EVE domain-containing protein [Ktedonobacteraceae bacterium]
MTETRFWIGVVSHEHVQRGVELGIAQFNHGKRAPAARLHQGDWLIYYSPRTSYPSGAPLQAFTAVGQITSEAPYQVTLPDGFQPFRHTVRYLPCRSVPIQEVLEDLTFLPDKQRWGARFRFGLLMVSRTDFQRIARAMGVNIPARKEEASEAPSFRPSQ